MKYKITLLMILAMLLFVVSLQTTFAANQTIDANTAGGIGGAINNASVNPGDTISLQPETYNKTGNDTSITISKNIILQGNGSTDSVIIDAKGLSRIFTIANNTNVTFINITFINGYNSASGGAILNNFINTSMTFVNCTFANNVAVNNGVVYPVGDISVLNSTFNNNSANRGGAIFTGSLANIIISNSIFNNNYAIYAGGAIYKSNSTNFTVDNCSFNNNSADSYGGAIYNWGGNASYLNSIFSNNSAIHGGAIDIILNRDSTVVVFVSNCTFNNNSVSSNGAAIRNNANLILSNSTFMNNNAVGNGSAVWNNGTLALSGNIMTGNTAGLGQMIYNNGTGTIGTLTLIYLSNSTITTSKGFLVTLYATLTDDMGNTVTGQDISFYVDGVFIANVTSIEGKANTTYLVTQGPGSVIPVTGDYADHDGYSIILKNAELLIPKIPTNITIDVPEEVKVGENTTITSRLTDKNGNPIANATIDFYVDGKKIRSPITDENGVAKIIYTFNKAGKPTIATKYAGNDTYEPSNATTQITVSKIKTNLELKN